ncbi:MAG TPA: MaoC family dehydratase [Rhizobiales bacterium]|nr:MaoC family dehydratase [Hyphomicrobiales bacterium]
MTNTPSGKTGTGNFFEDFSVGQIIIHATPRTISSGDQALYTALYGSRFAVQSATSFARSIGYPQSPVDDMLVFHIVFGKTVADISLNAVANLGYADCRFLKPVYPGDTLSTVSEVIGVKQNSSGKTGVVYVRSTGSNQKGEVVLEYVRWVMVRKRDANSPAPTTITPELPDCVEADTLASACPVIDNEAFNTDLSGSPHRWGDYVVGEKIDHVDGMTVEESDHMLATRLYQNTAKVHFNQHTEGQGRFGRRLIYGGHVISLARALSFNGLGNAFHISAINGGRHIAPLFAGDTVYAWSQITDAQPITGRNDVAALRITTIATKDHPCADFPDNRHESSILELDYWVILPK